MKMKISSHSIRQHLAKERERRSPTAILFAQITLFATSLFLHKTTLSSKRDARGTKTALAYHTVALLLPFSELVLSQLKIFRRTNGCRVNLIANCSCLALAILFDKVYEKSLASLGVVLSMAVLVLLLLIIIRPRSDLGLFGFLIGVTGSVSYNLFQLGYKTWVVAAICFVLLGFKFWLDYNWLAVEEENLTASTRSRENKTFSKSIVLSLLVSETLIVLVFFVYWDFHLLRTKCRRDSSNSCNSSMYFLRWAICLSMLCLWFTVAIVRYRGIDSEEMSKKTKVKVDIESPIDQKTEEKVDDGNKQLQQGSLTTDSLKQRPKPSKVAEFSKPLSKTDVDNLGRIKKTQQTKQRLNQTSLRAYFTKYLSHTDVTKAMIIPSKVLKYLPECSRGGTTNIDVKDEFSQQVWKFELGIRSEGDLKPVFQGGWLQQVWNFGLGIIRSEGDLKPVFQGEWLDFCHEKNLKARDKISFYVYADMTFGMTTKNN